MVCPFTALCNSRHSPLQNPAFRQSRLQCGLDWRAEIGGSPHVGPPESLVVEDFGKSLQSTLENDTTDAGLSTYSASQCVPRTCRRSDASGTLAPLSETDRFRTPSFLLSGISLECIPDTSHKSDIDYGQRRRRWPGHPLMLMSAPPGRLPLLRRLRPPGHRRQQFPPLLRQHVW